MDVEPILVQPADHEAGARPVIENAQPAGWSQKAPERFGLRRRARGDITGINLDVIGIVNEPGEIVWRPIVEKGREQKFAIIASEPLDRNARWAESVTSTVLVKIRYIKKSCQTTAYFAVNGSGGTLLWVETFKVGKGMSQIVAHTRFSRKGACEIAASGLRAYQLNRHNKARCRCIITQYNATYSHWVNSPYGPR